MSYTDELKQLIKRVDETRPQRLAKKKEGWEFPRMSLAAKEDRLRMFHPSYKEGALQKQSKRVKAVKERVKEQSKSQRGSSLELLFSFCE